MTWRISAASVATVVALNMVAFAQTAPPKPQMPSDPAKAEATTQDSAAQKITVVGCVQRESDYRDAADAGKGGVAGTGVGVGNEFVLINASISTGSEAPTGTAGKEAAAPAGTSGSAAGRGEAYELTGSNEGQAERYVGKRVEIVGMVKAADVKAGAATGGPTAGHPPSGVDVTSKDLQLRELEPTSYREMTGSCS
jgi:hypothetical protein